MIRKFPVFGVLFVAIVSSACRGGIEIPTEFPTPPPVARATPLSRMAYSNDVELEKQIAKIAEQAKGRVGVAAVVLETGPAAFLNADQRFPMQSVYKLPISMAVIDQIRQDKLSLEEKIGVGKDEMVREGQRSPLRDKTPDGGEYTIRELIRLALVESDGTASDVLMRVAGGPTEIQSFLTDIGVQDLKVINSERELGANWQTQYDNWATPTASIELLRWLHESQIASGKMEFSLPDAGQICNCPTVEAWNYHFDDIRLIVGQMQDSRTGPKRLKGQLPKGVVVSHKTGTGGTRNGITSATNDIGIIYLPNGKCLAIAVYISDSSADEKTLDAVIAQIAKACWDKWAK